MNSLSKVYDYLKYIDYNQYDIGVKSQGHIYLKSVKRIVT